MAYEIDTNVALGNRASGRKSKIAEMPFDKLAIGESFHIPDTRADASTKYSGYCQIASKRFNKRFSMRTVDDHDPRGPGVRIFRVEDKAQSLDSLFAASSAPAVAPAPEVEKVVAPKAAKAKRARKTPVVAPVVAPVDNRRQRKAASENRSFA